MRTWLPMCHAMHNTQSNHDDPGVSTVMSCPVVSCVMLQLLLASPASPRPVGYGSTVGSFGLYAYVCACVLVCVPQYLGRYAGVICRSKQIAQLADGSCPLTLRCPNTSSHYPETTSQDMMAWRAWLHLAALDCDFSPEASCRVALSSGRLSTAQYPVDDRRCNATPDTETPGCHHTLPQEHGDRSLASRSLSVHPAATGHGPRPLPV